jgi:hypothetical protein
MSRRATRQPHPRMPPFAYAPRLRPIPRFAIRANIYVCVSRAPINGQITDAVAV